MKKIEFKDYEEPYVSAETLNEMQDNIEEAIDEKGSTSGSGIHIGPDEPTDTDVWINPDEPMNVVGTEVVNSMSGNETNMAPSVRAVKEYISHQNIYSTEEQVVGTWIDGKPIYRKVLSYTGTISNNTTKEHGISNLGQMVDIYGWIYNLPWGQIPLPMVHSYIDGMIGFGNFNSTTFTWFVGSDIQANLSNIPIVIILEYTKTTDLEEE